VKDEEVDHPPQNGEPAKAGIGVLILKGFLWLPVICLLLVILSVFLQSVSVWLEIPFRMGLGWAFHLQHTLPEIRWSAEMVFSSLIAMALAALSLNYVARRLCLLRDSKAPVWTWRATAGVTLSVAVLFGSAVCGAGIVHQMSWLMRTEWITDGFGASLYGPNANKARQLVFLTKDYGSQAGGYLPKYLEDLQYSMEEPGDIQPLLIPKSQDGAVPEPWIYLGASLPTNAPAWLPILAQPRPIKTSQKSMRVVFLMSGESKVLNEQEYQTLLSRRRAYLQEKSNRP
jgi:hypothetical protein